MSPKLLNVLLVLVPLVMYYGFIEPMYTGNPGIVWSPSSSIRGLQSTNVQYVNAINLVSAATLGIKKINDEYLAVSTSSIEKAELMLPDSIDRFKLRNEVISIADKSGVAITGLAIAENAKNSNGEIQSYTISFGVKARYPALKRLLQEYEKSTRFYTIESITINVADPKGLSPEDLLLFDSEALVSNVVYTVAALKP